MLNEILLDRSGVTIKGEKTFLLCASLFYFRIPRAEWEDRVIKLKQAGYNCVDVYFPWNFHETAPECWDFAQEKDASAFLDLLQKYHLYVIARPGPYICSEWDGGGLPAWVLTNPAMRIREKEPNYLAAVREWYAQILPILAAHQADRGGPVILMQIENELDFFDCSNPRAYMEALRDMARAQGITVPLFGCAGQGSVEGATGWADGVHVSFNFYGDVCDPHFSEKFHYYAKRLEALDRPLLISETSCDHLLLRRELAAGAKLLGPYNQVGGTNFGFTGSVNNWGKRTAPASFITTYYSGENMIGPAGELHTQYFEARQFAGLLHTFGTALAGAESVVDAELTVSCAFQTDSVSCRLALAGGGSLVCVANLGQTDGIAQIFFHGLQEQVTVKAHDAPFFPLFVPLSRFGADATLCFANGELEDVKQQEGKLVLTFWSESETPFAVLQTASGTVRLSPEQPENDAVRVFFQNKRMLRGQELCGVTWPVSLKETEFVPAGRLTSCATGPNLLQGLSCRTEPVQPLESYEVYRGMGSYHLQTHGQGLLLLGAGDLVSVRRNDGFSKSFVGAGAGRFLPGSGSWSILAAIWGHSNFADARLPGLMLDANRGISAAVDVFNVQELESNWLFSYCEGGFPESLRVPQRAVETMVSINAWNTTRTPLQAVYRKQVVLCHGCDSYVLQIQKAEAQTEVYADGVRVGLVNPLDSFLDLSAFLQGKEIAELELCVTKRDWNEPVGTPVLYAGNRVSACGFAPLPEETLTRMVQTAAVWDKSTLPLRLPAGEMRFLRLSMEPVPQKSIYLRLSGKSIFAAVWVGEKLLGRVLDWDAAPQMCGKSDLLYLPASYCQSARELRLLVLALEEGAQLNPVTLEQPQLF